MMPPPTQLKVGDVVRCPCASVDQIVVELKDGDRVRTNMSRGSFTSNAWGHFTLVTRTLSAQVKELGGVDALVAAWRETAAMQVLSDALLERAWIALEFVDEPKDVALLRLERAVRKWIVTEIEPMFFLRAVSYPNTVFSTGFAGRCRVTLAPGGLDPTTPRLLADPSTSAPRAVVPMTAVRDAGATRRRDQNGKRAIYNVTSRTISDAPWLDLLSHDWLDNTPLLRDYKKTNPCHIRTLVAADSAKEARQIVADALGLEPVVWVDDDAESTLRAEARAAKLREQRAASAVAR